MKLIDLHCDTISCLMGENKENTLKRNNLSVDLEKLQKGDYLAQTFALFVNKEHVKSPHDYCMKMAEKFFQEIKDNSSLIALALNYDDIIQNDRDGKLSAILSIEEGATIEGSLKNLKNFYDIGVRMMTLTWNHENEIGYPNKGEENYNKGLKSFGIESVEYMNELGMLVDVSHLSDGGFYDVAKVSKKPFIATHSNARSVTGHMRNLTDDMIKILANKGGVTGINFCSAFMGDHGYNTYIDDMIKHITHIRNVGGIEVLAIGTDFDGISSKVEISNAGEMGKLVEALEKAGFKEEDIEKIYYKNALRLIKDVL
ncbi:MULTISPECIES: dipeptidase [Clostridium]|uniref:dipeptidase n=1 Tax=Clostridium TaxID=1485 RepID=UPI00040B8129|nr:dipeptidase [Clostridium cadaveris]MDM8312698.1 dipeptidase [Clostridium cadaveris]MDU4953599.1 dipeptidase [Clostridium sp.]NME66164.1 membrane dipeptidase [Clostridium cadaveris]NWK11120.1 membrane dipeptidase [Clostridium cadaveris]